MSPKILVLVLRGSAVFSTCERGVKFLSILSSGDALQRQQLYAFVLQLASRRIHGDVFL